jgi:thymidylate kinase
VVIRSDSTAFFTFPHFLNENPQGVAMPLEPFVRDFLNQLNLREINWAVIRNAENLPEYTRNDIDILLEQSSLKEVISLAKAIAARNNCKCLAQIKKPHYLSLMIYTSEKGGQYLPLDFFTGFERWGVHFADSASVLSARIKNNKGVWTVPVGYAGAISMLKEIMYNNRIKEPMQQNISSQAKDDEKSFCFLLERCLPGDLSVEICRYAINNSWDRINNLIPEIKKNLRRANPGWIFRFFDVAVKEFLSYFSYSLGCCVVFSGPDGCGKTTIAQELAKRTHHRPFKGCVYIRNSIGILPKISEVRFKAARIFRKNAKNIAIKEDLGHAGMMKPLNAFKSMIVATYYAADMFIGRIFLNHWRSQWNLIIFDRSFFDYYFQLGHRNVPHWYLNFLRIFVPKPDVLISLKRDASSIYHDKHELTIEEIENEEALISNLAKKTSYAVEIDANKGIEATSDSVTNLVLNIIRKPD